MKVKVLVIQSCLTLFDPMDCSFPGSCVHGDSPGKNTGVGCHALLQGIFPTPGSNLGLLNCRQILYHPSVTCALFWSMIFFIEHIFHYNNYALQLKSLPPVNNLFFPLICAATSKYDCIH